MNKKIIKTMSLVAMSTTLGAATAPLGAATEVDITEDIEISPANNFWERRHYRRDLEDTPVVSKNDLSAPACVCDVIILNKT